MFNHTQAKIMIEKLYPLLGDALEWNYDIDAICKELIKPNGEDWEWVGDDLEKVEECINAHEYHTGEPIRVFNTEDDVVELLIAPLLGEYEGWHYDTDAIAQKTIEMFRENGTPRYRMNCTEDEFWDIVYSDDIAPVVDDRVKM